tara:strand:- start:399 stop:605 length:207 start_codon:yes stop_codon:yes gene_type:complete
MEFNYIKVMLNDTPIAVLKLEKGSNEELDVVNKLIDNEFVLLRCTAEYYESILGQDISIELFDIDEEE